MRVDPGSRGCGIWRRICAFGAVIPLWASASAFVPYPGPNPSAYLPAPRPPSLVEAVDLRVDFEALPLGIYGADAIRQDWPGLRWVMAVSGNCTISTASAQDRNRVLMAVYPAASYGAVKQACQWRTRSAEPFKAGYLSYKVRFAKDFEFVRGGKLPGVVGGAANTGRRRPNGHDGFSARMMWREDGRVVHYVYHPWQHHQYGDDFPWDRGYTRYFVPGQWHRIEMYIAMNDPGENNGVLTGWLDGDMALHVSDMEFRQTDGFGVDGFIFSTFFGGADPSWAPSRTQFIDFDDFRLVGYR